MTAALRRLEAVRQAGRFLTVLGVGLAALVALVAVVAGLSDVTELSDAELVLLALTVSYLLLLAGVGAVMWRMARPLGTYETGGVPEHDYSSASTSPSDEPTVLDEPPASEGRLQG
jgi:hypothetical protein